MAELLISNTDANNLNRGEVVAYYDSPWTWGAKEGLPNYVQLSVPDATIQQVANFLENWQVRFAHEILAQNDQGYRVQIKVDPVWISVSDINKYQMHSKMQDFIVDRHAGVIVSIDSEQMTADLPKPIDLQIVKTEFADIFDKYLNARRYYFDTTDMDLAVSQGGQITLTKAQALNRIVDKLNE